MPADMRIVVEPVWDAGVVVVVVMVMKPLWVLPLTGAVAANVVLTLAACFRRDFLATRNGIVRAQAQFRMYLQRKRYVQVRLAF